MTSKYLLFDFDGVIADSWAPAFEVNKLMCPNITETDYKKAFEGNIKDWDKSGIIHTENCRHDLNFFEAFVPRFLAQTAMFPGIDTVIKDLANAYKLIVVSSTISAPIKELLEKFNLAEYFIEVMGNDVHASKVEKIKMVFSKYQTTADGCVFITDTLGDIHEAKKCGVGSIGVSWGFLERATLLRGNPFAIIDSPAALPKTIAEYFEKK